MGSGESQTGLPGGSWIVWLVLSLTACTAPPMPAPARDAEAVERREWTVLFVVPNDNDLDVHAQWIEEQIVAGVRGDRVAAALLVDRAASDGLRRVAVTGEGASTTVLETDDITDVAVVESYLRWASETLPAHRYTLHLLGHGGRIDEIHLDADRGSGNGAGWASVAEVGGAIRRWSTELAPGNLELLMLHQCGVATIENLYSFRETADVVVASETFVGAPNTYYRPLLRRLSARPERDGESVARTILDIDEHSATLSIFHGPALAEIPRAADRLAAAFGAPTQAPLARPRTQVPAAVYSGEMTYDLCAYLRELAWDNDRRGHAELERQLDWFERELVKRRSSQTVLLRNLAFPYVDPRWCGVAMLVPGRPGDLGDHGELPFFRESRWEELLGSLARPRLVLGVPDVRDAE